MNEATQAIQDTPALALLPAILLITAGLVLWIAGSRIVKAALAMLGGLLGVGLGMVLSEAMTGWLPEPGVPAWAAAGTLGLLLALVGALVSRLAIGLALALVGATAAPATVLAVHAWTGPAPAGSAETAVVAGGPETALLEADPDEPERDPISDWLFPDRDDEPAADEPAAEDEPAGTATDPLIDHLGEELGLGPDTARVVQEARGRAEQASARIGEMWSETPEQIRPVMIGSSIVGFLVGLAVAALAQALSAMLVTASLGSFVALSGFSLLLTRLGVVEDAALAGSIEWFLVLWLIISLIGLSIQWMFRPKRADKPG
jgi:hypothetical protein